MPKKIEKSDTDQIKERAASEPDEVVVTPNEGDFSAVISTGSTLLDLDISGGRVRGGGVPKGILMEIFGPSQCVDCDTEFLSPEGWKKISEYNNELVMQYDIPTDTGCFVTPIEYIKQPSNELYQFQARYIDQCLSLNHTVVYRYRKRKKPILTLPFYEVKRRHEENVCGFESQFITAFNYQETENVKYINNIDVNKLKVSVMSIADGSFYHNKNSKTRCVLNIKRGYKVERAQQLLNAAGVQFKISYFPHNGYSRIYYIDPYVGSKDFPLEWYRLPKSALAIIANECLQWDGNRKNEFYSTNKSSADFIQFVFLTQCKRASLFWTTNKVGCTVYTVRVTHTRFVTLKNDHDSKAVINKIVPKDGYQYCFQVPSGCLVLRRNNKVFITGNSGKTAVLAEMCADAQLKGGRVKFLDPEGRLDKEYSRIYGMQLVKDDYHMPDTVTEVFDHITNWNPEDPPANAANIIATDSLAALSSDLEMSEKGDKRGQKIAKDFSQGLRKTCRLIKRSGLIIPCSNQIRQGDYGETTSGGKGIPFYASIRVRIGPPAQGRYLVKEKTIHGVKQTKTYGIQSTYLVKKSVDDPYRTGNLFIVFGFGIDDIRGNLSYLKTNTKSEKYDAITKEFAQMDSAIRHIEENNLELDLKNKVIDLWEEIESTFKVDRKPKKRGII